MFICNEDEVKTFLKERERLAHERLALVGFLNACRQLQNGSSFDVTDSPLSFITNIKELISQVDGLLQQKGGSNNAE